METALAVSNLQKVFPPSVVVNKIYFSLECGKITTLLGPNGAGKTTLINMLLGLIAPTAGTITIAGYDLRNARKQALQKTNFAAVYARLPGNLTVIENLYTYALLYAMPNPRRRAYEVLEQVEMTPAHNKLTGTLSSGQQALISIAKSLINKPTLLLLDEPTASLDPAHARSIQHIIQNYVAKERASALWVSHNLQEIERVSTDILFLDNGSIKAQDSLENLMRRHEASSLEHLFSKLQHQTS